MTPLITLSNGKLSATLCPGIGGSIARFQYGTIDVLRPASAHAIEHNLSPSMALYPMVPCSGRIVNGQLDFKGSRYTLTPNFPPEPHAIHGVGWRRAWRVEEQSASRAVISLDHVADADWPFSFRANQVISLEDVSLTLTYTLVNSGTGPMPAGLGFHPFFPRTEDTTLHTEWRNIWLTDAAMVPVELQAIPATADFSIEREIGGWRIDNCFTGWNGHAVVGYPTHRVEISASAGLDRCVCFIPDDERKIICVEPVSHVVNAFNRAAAGETGTGARTMQPGDSWTESMTLKVSGPKEHQ